MTHSVLKFIGMVAMASLVLAGCQNVPPGLEDKANSMPGEWTAAEQTTASEETDSEQSLAARVGSLISFGESDDSTSENAPTDDATPEATEDTASEEDEEEGEDEDDNDKYLVCHRTSSESNPWNKIEISESAVQNHIDQHGDKVLGEVGDPETDASADCETAEGIDFAAEQEEDDEESEDEEQTAEEEDEDGDSDKYLVCHRTASDSNPWVKVEISESAVPAHLQHEHDGESDKVLGEVGDPETDASADCETAEGIDFAAEQEEDDEESEDEEQTAEEEDKVTVCHVTGSEKNRYVKITISRSALEAHLAHKKDGYQDQEIPDGEDCPEPNEEDAEAKDKGPKDKGNKPEDKGPKSQADEPKDKGPKDKGPKNKGNGGGNGHGNNGGGNGHGNNGGGNGKKNKP